ncbi:MAG: 4Fe-4S dicluster domain-containing protein [Raoultibacter sp.]
MAKNRYAMVIDTRSCIGCNSCAVACKMENNIPNNIWWNKAVTVGGENVDTPAGTYPNLSWWNYTLSCQHCENPACVRSCPVGATYKDPTTGIVMQDYDKCIGCRMCMAACPYTSVRSFNWEEPQYNIGFATGAPEVPAHQKHTVEKCVFCHHRVSQGLKPACVDVCPGRARFFGDLNDPNSEVSQLILNNRYEQLLTENGTEPNVYFLI